MTGKRRAAPGSRPAAAPRPPGTGGGRRRAARPTGGGGGRPRWLVWLLLVVVVAGGAGAAYELTRGTGGGSSEQAGGDQTTLLVQIAGNDGKSLGGILVGTRPGSGVEVLVPPDVITSVCGVGETAFGDILPLPGGERTSSEAVSGLLGGVRIDGTWTLSLTELSALVDKVGGITTTVDTTVTRHGPKGRVVVVRRGNAVTMNGHQAALYAAFRAAAGENPVAHLVRLQRVVEATIDGLPTSPPAAARDLSKLGSNAGSSLGADRLAAILAGLAADDRGSGVLADDLPLTTLDSGGAPSYAVDNAQAEGLAQHLFAGSLPATGGPATRVELQNGVGTPGLVPSACRQLEDAGMTTIDGGNAAQFSSRTSEVLIQERTAAAAAVGDRVARALHLPTSDVKVEAVGQHVADVIVILGGDYKP